MDFNHATTQGNGIEVASCAHLNRAARQLFGDPDKRRTIAECDRADDRMLHWVGVVDTDTKDVVFDNRLIVTELFRRQKLRGRSVQSVPLSSDEQQCFNAQRNIKLACRSDGIERHAGDLMQMSGVRKLKQKRIEFRQRTSAANAEWHAAKQHLVVLRLACRG